MRRCAAVNMAYAADKNKNLLNMKKKRDKMKKIIPIILLILFLAGCKELSELTSEKESPKELSELQVTACNTADEAGTCDTRLVELGIVLKEDCCKILKKCC